MYSISSLAAELFLAKLQSHPITTSTPVTLICTEIEMHLEIESRRYSSLCILQRVRRLALWAMVNLLQDDEW